MGSLFAGCGGMDLGLERAGFECVWQVEVDPVRRAMLETNWPGLRRHDDVRSFLRGDGWRPAEWACDLLAGGFPCQDISHAAGQRRSGLAGERSSLWFEMSRAVRVLRPRYVLVENVPALLSPVREKGRVVAPAPVGRVLGDLAELGYVGEYDCFACGTLGAPHPRQRVFIVAYPAGGGRQGVAGDGEGGRAAEKEPRPVGGRPGVDADPGRPGLPLPQRPKLVFTPEAAAAGREAIAQRGWWSAEPAVGRVVHGVPGRVDSITALGNSVVPQVAEWVGLMLMEAIRNGVI
jgi:DNA (cytosine-5)-methyltransferase 1